MLAQELENLTPKPAMNSAKAVQDEICEVLNNTQYFQDLSVTFIPECALDLQYQVKDALARQSLAATVITPNARYIGHDGLYEQWQFDPVIVRIFENPLVSREMLSVTNLDIAFNVAEALAGPQSGRFGDYCPRGIDTEEYDAALLKTDIKFATTIRTIADGMISSTASGRVEIPFAFRQELTALEAKFDDLSGSTVKTDELSNYVKQNEISDFLISSDLSNYATKSDISVYAKQTDLEELSSTVLSNTHDISHLSDTKQDKPWYNFLSNTSVSAGVFHYDIANSQTNLLTADWKETGSAERLFYFPQTNDLVDFTLYLEVPEDATYDNYSISWNTGDGEPSFLIQDGAQKTKNVAKGEKWQFTISETTPGKYIFKSIKLAEILPYDAEVEYIESDNHSQLNTGIYPETANTVRFKVRLPSYGKNQAIFTAYRSEARPTLRIRVDDYYKEQQAAIYCGCLAGYDPTGTLVKGDAQRILEGWMDGPSQKAVVNGVEYTLSTTPLAEKIDSTLYVLPGNSGGGRIYYLKIDNQLDIIPVRFTNENGQTEGAFYDKVTKKLFRITSCIIGPDK